MIILGLFKCGCDNIIDMANGYTVANVKAVRKRSGQYSRRFMCRISKPSRRKEHQISVVSVWIYLKL